MIGGDKEVVDALQPCFEAMSSASSSIGSAPASTIANVRPACTMTLVFAVPSLIP